MVFAGKNIVMIFHSVIEASPLKDALEHRSKIKVPYTRDTSRQNSFT